MQNVSLHHVCVYGCHGADFWQWNYGLEFERNHPLIADHTLTIKGEAITVCCAS